MAGIAVTITIYSTVLSSRVITRPDTQSGEETVLNHARRARGQKTLSYSARLDREAAKRAASMRAGGLSHAGLEGTRRRLRVRRIGENLARGCGSTETCTRLWLLSPGHRRVLLDPTWTQIGVARQGSIWVALFARS